MVTSTVDPQLLCQWEVMRILWGCEEKAKELGWTKWAQGFLRIDDRYTFATKFEVILRKIA